jgi:hypothetical protein
LIIGALFLQISFGTASLIIAALAHQFVTHCFNVFVGRTASADHVSLTSSGLLL